MLRRSLQFNGVLRAVTQNLSPVLRGSALACARPLVRQASTKPDDRLIGDYPEVPVEYYQYRSAYKKYYDQQAKRHFNEPLHQNSDLMDVWSPDRFDMVPDSTAIRYNLYFIGGVVSFFGIIYFFFYPERPAVKRNYPYGGLYKALGGTEKDKELYQADVDEEYS